MSISEQVKELRDYANLAAISKSEENMILRAADTIESLSAKLADMNNKKEHDKKMLKHGFCPDCGSLVGKGVNSCFECGSVLDWDLIKDMERSAEDCGEERENPLKEGDIVQHFKRETVEDKEHSMEYLYIIKAIATHTETNEKLVVYRALYKNEEKGIHFNAFVRPYDMFMGKVDHEKYPQIKQKYRFEKFEYGGEI